MTGETERDWLEGNDSRTQHEEMARVTARPGGRCAVRELLATLISFALAEPTNEASERARNAAVAEARAALASPCCLGDSSRESSCACESLADSLSVSAADLEQVKEALEAMLDLYNRHARWCGYNKDAPGDYIHVNAPEKARAALALLSNHEKEERIGRGDYPYGY